MSDHVFHIASHLLTKSGLASEWSNLGDWTGTDDYEKACQQLAIRVGSAADLSTKNQILDIACGNGASLRLWSKFFNVRFIDGIEVQKSCVERIRRAQLVAVQQIIHADAEHLLAQNTSHRAKIKKSFLENPYKISDGIGRDVLSSYDAIVCVDAAYHFKQTLAFLKHCSTHLNPNGCLSMTHLMIRSIERNGWKNYLVQLQFRVALFMARISRKSLLTAEAWRQNLNELGFQVVTIDNLDQEVLKGFSDYVAELKKQVSLSRRWHPSWWKIWGTGIFCRFVYQNSLLSYALISAKDLRKA